MMTGNKRFAPAADQNKEDILTVLRQELAAGDHVLELGSGTGQHLCHFAAKLPNVSWQPSELAENLADIRAWMSDAGCANLKEPIELNLDWTSWPEMLVECCYTANTLHIVSEATITSMFAGCAKVLRDGGKFCAYGPFMQGGQHVSESNAGFDASLRTDDPDSGVRDITTLDAMANASGFNPARLIIMPVNNRMLVWSRKP